MSKVSDKVQRAHYQDLKGHYGVSLEKRDIKLDRSKVCVKKKED
jgi:hypothetical protein